ncbi:response regulator transcription factor [Pseudoxanthomonas putridarboris]|uniref:Response regulator transcription factor n=1 Tax=Pseudoxanthomonas putridarboris TaxID=752605 RepID=A0ABU9J3C0_9GAMM
MSEPNFHLSPPRVVVVEDEDELRELVVDDLRARGYAVVGLPSAEALYRHMSVHALDIVVLDIGLPGENGFGVAAHLRQLARVGIIMLTARGGGSAMAQGLAEGADLFLTKPVDYDVLAVAIANLHRRLAAGELPPGGQSEPARAWSLSDNGWTLHGPDTRTLALSEAERTILVKLFEQPGEPIARTLLIEALTDQPWDFDPHRLDMLVHRLRARAGSVFAQPLPLRAIRGTGYVLTP